MLDLVTGFAAELRTAGVPVSVTETLDAAAATTQVPLHDRAAVRDAWAVTLIKDQVHADTFDIMFDIYFTSVVPGSCPADRDWRPGGPAPRRGRGDRAAEHRSLRRLPPTVLEAMLITALLAGDRPAIAAVAREAVTRYSTIEPDRPITGRYYVYRTLRGLGFDDLAGKLAGACPVPAGDGALQARLAADEHARRLAYLRAEVEAEVRRRLVEAQGTAAIAGIMRPALPLDVEFLRASPEDLEAMQALLRPLARRLAGRLRPRGPRGRLDLRTTMRRSLSYGGAPAEPRFRGRRPVRPELMVIADVSGSMAAFARFALLLMSAIGAEFRGVRGFVFIDTVTEVTGLLDDQGPPGATADRISRAAWAVTADGRSDYGNALLTLWRIQGAEISPRTTVLILGDARNNYRRVQAWVLRELAARAGHLFWLNPEPRARWDTGDSVLGQYAPHCDAVAECRNLRQLASFAERLINVRRANGGDM